MKMPVWVVIFMICGSAWAQEAQESVKIDGEAGPLTNGSSDVFELMLQTGCAVATDGCKIYRQKVFGSVPMRQETLASCPGTRRQFVCQQY